MDESYPKSHRITKRSEFERVYRNGKRLENNSFRIHIMSRDGEAIPRLGLSTSKRIGKSVTRNRLKRHVREWFRSHKVTLAGLDIIVSAKAAAVGLEQGELATSLDLLIADYRSLKN